MSCRGRERFSHGRATLFRRINVHGSNEDGLGTQLTLQMMFICAPLQDGPAMYPETEVAPAAGANKEMFSLLPWL